MCSVKTRAEEPQGGESKKPRCEEAVEKKDEAMMVEGSAAGTEQAVNEEQGPPRPNAEDLEEELPRPLVEAGMREEFSSLERLSVYDEAKLQDIPAGGPKPSQPNGCWFGKHQTECEHG